MGKSKKYSVVWSPTSIKQVKKIRKSMPPNEADIYLTRVKNLIEAIKNNPYLGTGKPEHLKYFVPSCWSRRINFKDRLIYRIVDDEIQIVSILGHYNKRN